MNLLVTLSSVVMECLVKRKGKWHVELIQVPESWLSSRGSSMAITFKVSRTTLPTIVRATLVSGTELSWPVVMSSAADRGDTVVIEVSV